jgi:hypothetical protein
MCEEKSQNDFEEKKLKIELDKLVLEREKFDLEKRTAVLTAFSSVIPVLVVAATIVWGVVSSREQANLNFKLEAAKTVMAA